MLTALDAAVLIIADHIAVVFVQEGELRTFGFPPMNERQPDAEVIKVLVASLDGRIDFLVQLEPDARVDWVEPSVLFFEPATEMTVMIASDNDIGAPRAGCSVDELPRFTKLLRYVFGPLGISLKDSMRMSQLVM